MLRIFIKRLLGIDNNKKLYKTYNLDQSAKIYNSASIYCVSGGTYSDVQMEKKFSFVEICCQNTMERL